MAKTPGGPRLPLNRDRLEALAALTGQLHDAVRLADLDGLDQLLERRRLLLESLDWQRLSAPEMLQDLEKLASENQRLLALARGLKDKLGEHLEGLATLLKMQRLYSSPPPAARFIDARQ
jgi:hypothetical protein